MNGFETEADKHARFYPNIQYTEDGQGLYATDKVGRFPMNAFADYVPGGPIDWEIDNTGFALWVYRIRAAFLSRRDPVAARAFLTDIRESALLAADLLRDCRDDTNSLQCHANEDDNPGFTQGFHGAITTWLGMRSAADIFEALGETERAATYQARADELNAAIRTEFKTTDIHPQGLGWSYWPARFWNEDDADVHNDAAVRMMERIESELMSEETNGSQYLTKATIALLTEPMRTPDTEAFAREAHTWYLNKMARQDTLHLSEFTSYYDIDGDGAKEYINHVATPHIWAQALVYLSLMADEMPELLEEPAIVKAAPAHDNESSGCACRTGSQANPGAMLPLAAAMAWLLLRRRLD